MAGSATKAIGVTSSYDPSIRERDRHVYPYIRHAQAPALPVNPHHKWVRRFDRDGGELYLQCIACGKDLHDIKRHTRIIDFGGGF